MGADVVALSAGQWGGPPVGALVFRDPSVLERLPSVSVDPMARGPERLELGPHETDELVEAVRGLSAADAERLIRQAALKDGAITAEDVSFVRESRAKLLGGDGVLELVDPADTDLSAVGGMGHLKRWLGVRGRALEPAATRFGLDPPRGMLLTGIPGCGKSMVAKAVARTWGLPLALLDPARLYGPYVG